MEQRHYTEVRPRRRVERFAAKPDMDQLWSPWRFAYVTTADGAPRPGVPARLNAWPGDLDCVFCNLIASIDYAIEHGMNADDAEEAGGLIRARQDLFICLNAYPYTSGHVMVMPMRTSTASPNSNPSRARTDGPGAVDRRALEQLTVLMDSTFGLNLGQAAGRACRTSPHAWMPRWIGDTNFMTTVAETRVLAGRLGTRGSGCAGKDPCRVGKTLAALLCATGWLHFPIFLSRWARRGLLFL